MVALKLPNAEIIEPIELSGDALPAPDGLAILQGDLYTVSANSVSRVRTNTNYSAGEVVTVAQISGLSTATVAESKLYVIKSDVINFFLNRTLNIPFEIFRVDTSAFEQ